MKPDSRSSRFWAALRRRRPFLYLWAARRTFCSSGAASCRLLGLMGAVPLPKAGGPMDRRPFSAAASRTGCSMSAPSAIEYPLGGGGRGDREAEIAAPQFSSAQVDVVIVTAGGAVARQANISHPIVFSISATSRTGLCPQSGATCCTLPDCRSLATDLTRQALEYLRDVGPRPRPSGAVRFMGPDFPPSRSVLEIGTGLQAATKDAGPSMRRSEIGQR